MVTIDYTNKFILWRLGSKIITWFEIKTGMRTIWITIFNQTLIISWWHNGRIPFQKI